MDSTGQGPRREYTRRMHRVLAHIDTHLDQPLTLAGLATVAHFSPFHFHRLFNAWTGETLGDYLRRRRLEVAALRLLLQPRSSVLDIALAVGFGSAEAFAHAFKARFGCSATQWRRQRAEQRRAHLRNLEQAHRNVDQAATAAAAHDQGTPQPDPEVLMKVQIINRPAVQVAYARHIGPYGPGIGAFWQQTFHPLLRRHGLTDRDVFGISYDNPDITDPDKCRYDACVQVDDGSVAPAGLQVMPLPGGRYASMPFNGSSATIGAAWQALLRDWLPDSGYQLDNRPCFEHHPRGARYDLERGTFECNIVIPVMPL